MGTFSNVMAVNLLKTISLQITLSKAVLKCIISIKSMLICQICLFSCQYFFPAFIPNLFDKMDNFKVEALYSFASSVVIKYHKLVR